MHPHSNNTILKDRILWFDGDSTYKASDIERALMLGHSFKTFTDKITPEIKKYNNFIDKENKIIVKEEIRKLTYTWNIPEEYKQLDITKYVVDKLSTECYEMNDDEISKRAARVSKELKLFKNHKLIDVLRTIIFVINTLDQKGVVWGVGRGSSVSSYVLYLLGVHDVDSVRFNLDINDFLR